VLRDVIACIDQHALKSSPALAGWWSGMAVDMLR
jgi:hypothetical protein